ERSLRKLIRQRYRTRGESTSPAARTHQYSPWPSRKCNMPQTKTAEPQWARGNDERSHTGSKRKAAAREADRSRMGLKLRDISKPAPDRKDFFGRRGRNGTLRIEYRDQRF